MLLAQVWIGYETNFSFQNHCCHLIEFFAYKNYSKFNNSHTLGFKTSKSPSLYPRAFQIYQKCAQICLWSKWIFIEKIVWYSITSPSQVKTSWIQLNASYSKGFPKIPRTWQEVTLFGRCQHDKQTKQINYYPS
jgi:hypothetical protein